MPAKSLRYKMENKIKPTHMLGRSVARKSNPEDEFDEEELEANKNRFAKLEKLLQLNSPDASFRENISQLIEYGRAIKVMWLESPRRKDVGEELKSLQTSFRRKPEMLQKLLAKLSTHTISSLELNGLTEDYLYEGIIYKDIQKIIQQTLKHISNDKGGVRPDLGLQSLILQYAQLYKELTGNPIRVTFNSPKQPDSGVFMRTLLIIDAMTWKHDYDLEYDINADDDDDDYKPDEKREDNIDKRNDALEDMCKTLFYRGK